jgi:hypothetical protein
MSIRASLAVLVLCVAVARVFGAHFALDAFLFAWGANLFPVLSILQCVTGLQLVEYPNFHCG